MRWQAFLSTAAWTGALPLCLITYWNTIFEARCRVDILNSLALALMLRVNLQIILCLCLNSPWNFTEKCFSHPKQFFINKCPFTSDIITLSQLLYPCIETKEIKEAQINSSLYEDQMKTEKAENFWAMLWVLWTSSFWSH